MVAGSAAQGPAGSGCTSPHALPLHLHYAPSPPPPPRPRQTATYLGSSETTVVAPDEAELEAAYSAGADLSNSTAWLGCIVAERALMGGDVLEVLDGVGSAEACCRECRARDDDSCNVFNYCAQPQGCRCVCLGAWGAGDGNVWAGGLLQLPQPGPAACQSVGPPCLLVGGWRCGPGGPAMHAVPCHTRAALLHLDVFVAPDLAYSYTDMRTEVRLNQSQCEPVLPGLGGVPAWLQGLRLLLAQLGLQMLTPGRQYLCCAGELRYQALAEPALGWPAFVIAKGEGVSFVGGSPIEVAGPNVPGYTRLLGSGLFGQQGFDCEGSLR